MRRFLALAVTLAAALLVAPFAAADPYIDNAAIDELMAELATAQSPQEASDLTRQIWTLWSSPNVPDLATRMSVASNAVGEGLVDSGLEELTFIVENYPDYAEGWNQRATLHFRLGHLDESLADIEHTLAIEPRHFGALAGRVMIYLKQGRKLDALLEMRRALAIHPFLPERRFFPQLADPVTFV